MTAPARARERIKGTRCALTLPPVRTAGMTAGTIAAGVTTTTTIAAVDATTTTMIAAVAATTTIAATAESPLR